MLEEKIQENINQPCECQKLNEALIFSTYFFVNFQCQNQCQMLHMEYL
jgi:hypothetical protein